MRHCRVRRITIEDAPQVRRFSAANGRSANVATATLSVLIAKFVAVSSGLGANFAI